MQIAATDTAPDVTHQDHSTTPTQTLTDSHSPNTVHHAQEETHASTSHDTGHHGNMSYWQNMGTGPLLLNILPFVGLLLMIAILPLIPKVDHWWHQNKNKLMVAGLCAIAGVAFYLMPTGDWHKVLHTYVEYAAFIALLASLFIISGGIYISGPFAGFPHVNTMFLALGAVLANLMGTTGASMLLIRPLITANKPRQHKTHLMVFFIFIVANCGGLLTPLGDPPLYMGFLRGVPFEWTFSHLIPEWFVMVGMLLLVFLVLDTYLFTKEELDTKHSLTHIVQSGAEGKKLKIEGARNLGFLAMVVGVILASGYMVHPYLKAAYGLSNADIGAQLFQVVALTLITLTSYFTTPARIREANAFSFEPILEVACIFVGIFGAMIPALTILEAKGSLLPLETPWQYFWVTGGLSGFLDNAPTYLTFVTLAASKNGVPTAPLTEFVAQFPELLAAISVGAVFMGALTYIGNGPNFMVKTIAEHSNIKMPSFGGYILWSFSVLLPLLVIVTFLNFI